jgi:hypothetical protein
MRIQLGLIQIPLDLEVPPEVGHPFSPREIRDRHFGTAASRIWRLGRLRQFRHLGQRLLASGVSTLPELGATLLGVLVTVGLG